MAIFRDGGLSLEQMTAFAVSEDHDRQEQVHEQLSWNRSASAIRRAMTEAQVPAEDRWAVFVGVDAYAEAGGGWLEDAGLLDRLAQEKLDGIAAEVREREGWRWAEGQLDYPHGHGLRRIYAHPVERSEDEAAQITALSEEYDALVGQWDAVEDLPPEVEARFNEIDAALDAFGDSTAYGADDVCLVPVWWTQFS